MEFAYKVDKLEGHIDKDHLMAKISFIENSGKVDSPTFMVLKDLVDSIEHASDMCENTADFILVLAAGEV